MVFEKFGIGISKVIKGMMNIGGMILFAYLLGSIPFGLLLTRLFTDKNIHREGSGNIGATNVQRVAGTTLGVLTLAGDVAKGMLPVYLATKMGGADGFPQDLFLALVAAASVAGHFFPIFLKGHGGGKGVATTAGCFLILAPFACLVAIGVFLLACWRFNRVALGSLAAAAVLPLSVWFTNRSAIITGCAVVLSIGIAIRHKDNIRRIRSGTEPLIICRDPHVTGKGTRKR